MQKERTLPWQALDPALAHEHGQPFWLPSFGNLVRNSPLAMDDLIDLVKIDGFHSFQDGIPPVGEVKVRVRNRPARIGALDMGELSTLPDANG